MIGYGSALFDQHAKLLADSAISVEVARARGYVSVDTKARFADTGIAKAGRSTPGLLIPIHDVAGEVKLYQYRPDGPRLNGSGKPVKYETSVGRGLVVDVPPPIRDRISDPAVPLWVTEGARKADAAVTAGLCCVALLGVYGWRGSNGQGGKTALACWESIALNDRDIYLCFDSDVMTKREVAQALDRLGQFLASRGAKVRFVYLPDDTSSESVVSNGGFSRESAKVGLDDFLAAGHGVDELLALATTERRGGGSSTPPDPRATVQPLPVEPPKLASDQRILDRFRVAVRGCGVVGEDATAQLLYLLITSRLLDKPVSAAVKGHSSSGKSFTTETTVKFFPAEAVLVMTAMSERALVYMKDDFQHRTLVLFEATALREGAEDYFVRSLLSEGRIEYPVTVRGPDGNFTTKTIVKKGPTNLIVTTTKTRVHAENETRLLSLTTDDSQEQTARVLLALADETDGGVDLDEWHALQAWLQHAEHRVTIPYARQLAEAVPPVAVRLRRDFGALLALIRSHAILHQQTRGRDGQGRIVATVDDYEVVRELVADLIAEGVGATVSTQVRETVESVTALAGQAGVMARAVAERLGLDKSTVSRRLRVAADGGYIQNLEDKRGKPGRWVAGDPMPDETDLLPQPRNLTPDETPGQASGCAVARESERYTYPERNETWDTSSPEAAAAKRDTPHQPSTAPSATGASASSESTSSSETVGSCAPAASTDTTSMTTSTARVPGPASPPSSVSGGSCTVCHGGHHPPTLHPCRCGGCTANPGELGPTSRGPMVSNHASRRSGVTTSDGQRQLAAELHRQLGDAHADDDPSF